MTSSRTALPPISPCRLRVVIAESLPYTRWLDYCDVAYFVNERVSKSKFGRVLARLEQVSEAEAEGKLAALRRVRDAFVFRAGSSPERPCASEYVLSEVCEVARRKGVREEAVAGGTHRRCTLA